MGSTPSHTSNFSTPDCKKVQQSPSVRAIIICKDLSGKFVSKVQDSYNGVDPTSDESILHKILYLINVLLRVTVVCYFDRVSTLRVQLRLEYQKQALDLIYQSVAWSLCGVFTTTFGKSPKVLRYFTFLFRA